VCWRFPATAVVDGQHAEDEARRAARERHELWREGLETPAEARSF
jgi:hypothetical protein